MSHLIIFGQNASEIILLIHKYTFKKIWLAINVMGDKLWSYTVTFSDLNAILAM